MLMRVGSNQVTALHDIHQWCDAINNIADIIIHGPHHAPFLHDGILKRNRLQDTVENPAINSHSKISFNYESFSNPAFFDTSITFFNIFYVFITNINTFFNLSKTT